MVQISPCSESHLYTQQAASTPTSIVPSSRGLRPGLPSLGVWGLTTLLLHSLDLGIHHHRHTLTSVTTPTPRPGLNLLPSHPLDLLPSHPWTCSPFSPRDLLSPLTPWTCSPFSPPGPALPGGWVHPQGKMLPGLGPWSPGFGAHPGGPPGPPCTSLPGSIQPSCIPISSPPQSPPLTPTGLSALGEGLSAAMATASWLWSARQPPHCHRYGLFLIECLTLAQVVHLTYLMI